MTGAADRPSRRHVLRIGGAAFGLGTLAAACGSETEPAPMPGPGVETSREPADDPATDVSLLNTALSVEVLVLDAYQIGLDLGLVQSSEVSEAVTLFQQHHAEHRDVLIALVEAGGGDPFTTANPVVKAGLVDPSLAAVVEERNFVRLGHDLEQASAQLYVHAVTTLTTAELRTTAMSIGGAASRRATILDLLGDLGNERLARYPTTNPLPSDAIVPS